MEYGRIISVTGLGGLYELVGSKTDGALVKSLEDGNTRFVSSRLHNFSHLESIEVYTEGENVNLVQVFRAMKESNEPLPADNDAAAVTSYFKKVFPTMDFQRVYNSDRKKMVKWISIIEKAGIALKTNAEINEERMMAFEAEQAAASNATQEDNSSSEANLPLAEQPAALAEKTAEEAKPGRKAKAAAPAAEADTAEEAPKKKPARKKKTDDETKAE